MFSMELGIWKAFEFAAYESRGGQILIHILVVLLIYC